MAAWEREHPAGQGVVSTDMKLPIQAPQWDNQNEAHWGHMRDLGDLVTKGIKESVPHSQNMSKAFDVQQGREEGPA